MPNSQINVTLTVGQNPTNGNYTFAWSGDNVDSSGNLDFTSFSNAVQATITLASPTLDLSFLSPASNTMLMCPAAELPTGQCPTSSYSNGSEFNGFAFPANNGSSLQFIDNNNDDVNWAYALQIHNNGNNTNFVCDPNIINR